MITNDQRSALYVAESAIAAQHRADFAASYPDFFVGAYITEATTGMNWRIEYLAADGGTITPIATWINGGVATSKQIRIFAPNNFTATLAP